MIPARKPDNEAQRPLALLDSAPEPEHVRVTLLATRNLETEPFIGALVDARLDQLTLPPPA